MIAFLILHYKTLIYPSDVHYLSRRRKVKYESNRMVLTTVS